MTSLKRLQKTVKKCARKEDLLIRNRRLSEALIVILRKIDSPRFDYDLLDFYEAVERAKKVLFLNGNK